MLLFHKFFQRIKLLFFLAIILQTKPWSCQIQQFFFNISGSKQCQKSLLCLLIFVLQYFEIPKRGMLKSLSLIIGFFISSSTPPFFLHVLLFFKYLKDLFNYLRERVSRHTIMGSGTEGKEKRIVGHLPIQHRVPLWGVRGWEWRA